MRRLLAALALLVGCAHESVTQTATARTNELRAEFPPGKATRADVLARNGGRAEISLARPSTGWTHAFVRDVEDRSGLIVARAEKYISPTTTSAGFATLAHVWYFYDRFDVLVDVEWERIGD